MFPGRKLLCALLALSGVNAREQMVPGKAFDRFVTIWFENTDFSAAFADPNFAAAAKNGILLENYFAVSHPSEPNYVSAVGGDYFGMNNDRFNEIPANVSSIVDLLETKGISWAEYQEDLPSTGFAGLEFRNPVTGANDYVRKHNPLIVYNSVANFPERTANIKNFTLFEEDLANNNLPQWIFITPNETSDGHDTNVTFAGQHFLNVFVLPLLENPNFNTDKTLIFITFDETGTDNIQNRVLGFLLGGAVPKHLIGTTDSNFYTHYSEIATIEANWDLPTLGRYDVGANVFDFVAKKTDDKLREVDINQVLLNESYPGLFNSVNVTSLPIPNTSLVVNRRRVLESIVQTWGSPELQRCTVYNGSVMIPSGENPPVLPEGC